MTETVTIPRAEYDQLIAIAEDVKDARDADRIVAAIERGEEELLPASVVYRMADGESPVRVFREHRGYSVKALADRSGVNRVQLLDIEAGRKTGSVLTLRKIADALGVTIDDLV